MPRRERWSLFGEVLRALDDQRTHGVEVHATQLAATANVPFDRLKEYLAELESAGLVTAGARDLTPRGRTFLGEYRRWRRALEDSGLENA